MQTMNRLLMLIVLLLSATSARAEWTQVGESDSLTSYLDFATIRRTGNLVKVWQLFDFKTPHTLAGKTSWSAKIQEQYDCQEEQSRTLAFTEFSKNMGAGEVDYSTSDPGKWKPVEPESIGEGLFKTVCDKK
jgi:hypothetical protein